jgi:hypothetical protein
MTTPSRGRCLILNKVISKGELLKGRGTGPSLFLAWCLGALCLAVLHTVALNAAVNLSYYFTLVFVAFPRLAFSCWQALLLLPTWKRRIAWVAVELVVSTFAVYQYLNGSPHFYTGWIVIFLQTFALVGVRRRVWVWGIVAGALAFSPSSWIDATLIEFISWGYDLVLSEVLPFVPGGYAPRFGSVFLATIAMAFGALAAFLMPPVDRRVRGEEDNSLDARE